MDKPAQQGTPVIVARTAEELAIQLEKDLRGEKDWHDLVVESFERRAQEAREQRAQQLREMQQNYDAEYGPRQLLGSTSLQGLSPEEVKFQVERRRQLAAQRLQAVPPELVDPKSQEFHDKWSQAQRSSRDPSQVPLIPTSDRTPGTPFRTTRK